MRDEACIPVKQRYRDKLVDPIAIGKMNALLQQRPAGLHEKDFLSLILHQIIDNISRIVEKRGGRFYSQKLSGFNLTVVKKRALKKTLKELVKR